MKYFSTFSGIGGFELGIIQTYENNRNLRPTKQELEKRPNSGDTMWGGSSKEKQGIPHCIGFSEIDKYATQIYQKQFPKHKNYGDITKIKAEELPDFDLLVGGFPCQSFSIAGKRGGFGDTRGTMFFEIARIVREKQPSLLLLENVKGLLSHDKGQTFLTIISTLDELGYDCQWQVLNSKNHGVPQNRERVFIIGHLRGTRRPEVFPFGEGTKNSSESDGKDPSVCTPPITTQGGKNCRGMFIATGVNQPSRGMEARKDGIANTVRAAGGGAQTPKALVENKIRRLTPTECERLQGFPDGWTEGLSDTQRYKTLGNAVTVNVIRDIMEKLLWK